MGFEAARAASTRDVCKGFARVLQGFWHENVPFFRARWVKPPPRSRPLTASILQASKLVL